MRARARISSVEACSCRHCRPHPLPCTLLDLCMYYAASVKAGACAHYSACVRMRMRTESACTARLTRSDGSVGCNCTCREHAACNTTILAGWRMREQFSRRTNAHADSKTHAQRAFVWSLWALVSRLVSKQNVYHGQHGTQLQLPLPCPTQRVRTECTCCRRNCVHAGARMPHGAPGLA